MGFVSVKNIIHNCKQATLLILKKKEGRLSLTERIRLFIHLLFCDPCQRFGKQSDFIDHSLHHCEDRLHEHSIHVLPDEIKQKIQLELDLAK
jgi:hypothetical protein